MGSFRRGSGHSGVRVRGRAPGAKPRGWGSFFRHKIGSTGHGNHPIVAIFCKWVAFNKGQVIAGLGVGAEPHGWSPEGGSFSRHKMSSTGQGNHPIVAIFCKWVIDLVYIYIFLMDWITTKSGIVLLVTWCIFLCRNLSGWTAGEHCAATWWEVTPKTSTSTSTSGSDTCEVSKKHPSLVTVLLEKRDGNPIWLICARVLLFLRKWVE